MGKIKIATIITVISLIAGIPAAILAYQQIERPWPSKERMGTVEKKVDGLVYESTLAAYLRCLESLRKDPRNRWLRLQCEKLKRAVQEGK
jgi:hypothetical protein